MKCVGNCAICDLQVDKSACCAIQTLRQIIEVKQILLEIKNKDAFSEIPNIESEPTPSARRKDSKEG